MNTPNLSLIPLVVILSLALSGCSGQLKPPPPAPALTALSLEEWRQMPVEMKYDGASLDRLRMSDPRLSDDHTWFYYMARNVIPERKKDIPGIPGQPLASTAH